MKILSLLPAAFILFSSVSAQTFKPYPPALPIDGVTSGDMVLVDVDGDGDEDMLLTGSNGAGPNVKLFLNVGGAEIFEEVPNTPFIPVVGADADFADVDGDQDLDVIIAGTDFNDYNHHLVYLYLNNGDGNFTAASATPMANIGGGAVRFADVDGDLDQDVLITGLAHNPNGGNHGIANLYLNDGQGQFSLLANTPFEGVAQSSAAFADVDGDQDQDVIISGNPISSPYSTKLYLNDGAGNFSLKAGTPFTGGVSGSVSFADVDGDQDQDVLITGTLIDNNGFVQLCLNDGSGNFTPIPSSPFKTVRYNSAAWADPDGDGDQDVLINGTPTAGPVTNGKLYLNNGAGQFTAAAVTAAPFAITQFGEIAFSDLDGDTDPDVLISGSGNNVGPLIKAYENDGAGNYKEILAPFYEGVYQSSAKIVDIDGDHAPDLTYCGTGFLFGPTFRLYRNNGDGTGDFTEIDSAHISAVSIGDFDWADVDGDLDQDLLLSGGTGGSNRIVKLYLNNGSAKFTEAAGTPFTATSQGEVTFADVDGDNDPDVLITGYGGNQPLAQLYTNDGSGHFTLAFPTPFEGVVDASTAFADVDGDQDLDVVLAGLLSSGQKSAKLYLNNGAGNFEVQMDTPFEGIYEGDIAFADVDGDQDQDLFIAGLAGVFEVRVSKLYLNDGAGHFTEDTTAVFEGLSLSAVAFADLDGDDDQDLILVGVNELEERVVDWYHNDGAGHFTEITNHPFRGVSEGTVDAADLDGDQDVDVFITGFNSVQQRSATLYLNQGGSVAVAPEKAIVQTSATLYPNPAAEGHVMLEIAAKATGKAHVSLCDLNGKTLLRQTFNLTAGQNKLNLEYPSLQAGLYMLCLEEERQLRFFKLVIP